MEDSQEQVNSLALRVWEADAATVSTCLRVQWERCSAGTARLLLLWALKCQLQSQSAVQQHWVVCCFLHQPCHIRRHVSTLAVVPCLCPVPIKEEEHLLLSKNPKPPQLISRARRNPLRQAFLEKSAPVGTGMKVWDNNFPPALPGQWSVKPQRGTFCSLPCVQGKQGVNKIQ